MEPTPNSQPSWGRSLVLLALGPALILLQGWRIIFDAPFDRGLTSCALAARQARGPGTALIEVLGVILTLGAIRQAWRARCALLAEGTSRT